MADQLDNIGRHIEKMDRDIGDLKRRMGQEELENGGNEAVPC